MAPGVTVRLWEVPDLVNAWRHTSGSRKERPRVCRHLCMEKALDLIAGFSGSRWPSTLGRGEDYFAGHQCSVRKPLRWTRRKRGSEHLGPRRLIEAFCLHYARENAIILLNFDHTAALPFVPLLLICWLSADQPGFRQRSEWRKITCLGYWRRLRRETFCEAPSPKQAAIPIVGECSRSR